MWKAMDIFCLAKKSWKVYNKKKRRQPDKGGPDGKKSFLLVYGMFALLLLMPGTALASGTNDPLQVIDNLSVFIFALVRAIGVILLGFGILQIGLSLKGHDPSQRANGFMTFAGGLVITFCKEILDLILA